jgi:hypothetical protein
MQTGALCVILAVFVMLDPNIVSILNRISPSGIGPDGPMFNESELAGLARIPAAEGGLLAIVHDKDSKPDRRFVAAEALLEGGWIGWRANPEDRRAMAATLADALARDRVHNRWGLPGEFTGGFGKQLLTLGHEGDFELRRLLDDNRPLAIAGSEAATLNVGARYRVADLAAWLLASAHGIPWHNDPDPRVRDAEILRLRNMRFPDIK